MSRCCIYCRIGGTANEPNQIAMNSQLEMLRKAAEDLGLTVVADHGVVTGDRLMWH